MNSLNIEHRAHEALQRASDVRDTVLHLKVTRQMYVTKLFTVRYLADKNPKLVSRETTRFDESLMRSIRAIDRDIKDNDTLCRQYQLQATVLYEELDGFMVTHNGLDPLNEENH